MRYDPDVQLLLDLAEAMEREMGMIRELAACVRRLTDHNMRISEAKKVGSGSSAHRSSTSRRSHRNASNGNTNPDSARFY